MINVLFSCSSKICIALSPHTVPLYGANDWNNCFLTDDIHRRCGINTMKSIDSVVMEKIYTDPSHPAAFGGTNLLYSAVKKKYTKNQVKKFLSKQRTYRKFKTKPAKIARARIITSSVGQIYQLDIADMHRHTRYNKGKRYILTLVDCFSRKLYARGLKQKSADQTAEALKNIFHQIKLEGNLLAHSYVGLDLGAEFWNKNVYAVFKELNVHPYALRKPLKAAMVENAIRYLKDRIYKYVDSSGDRNWSDKLQSFVNAKNNRPLKSLGGLPPNGVTFENQASVFDNLYPIDKVKKRPLPLTIGQKVQISLDRLPFSKSYDGFYSNKYYRVKRRRDHNGIFRYTLEDLDDGAEISGTFYAEELLVE